MIWITRTLLLVLAGLATLSIIGAIAAIPANPLPPPGRAVVARVADKAPMPVSPRTPSARGAATADGGAAAGRGVGAPPDTIGPALAWLEPLTYAVIALAGFAAAILVALLRIAAALAHPPR